MPFILLLVALLLIVPAIRGTAGALGTALATDVPPFAVWFIALTAILSLGVVPGLKGPSRLLAVLVLMVLVLTKYQAIVTGFKDAVSTAKTTPAAASPATAYATSTGNTALATPPVSGTAGTATASTTPASATSAQTATGALAGLAPFLSIIASEV